MFKDLYGRRLLKINLHTHTTNSDGHKSPKEAASVYLAEGYDAIAITDHWKFTPYCNIGGLDIISGCEYDAFGPVKAGGTPECYHIVAVGCEREPNIPKEFEWDESPGVRARAEIIINEIHKANGIAILAHPAWSLNTPCQMLSVSGYDATEIYNSVSEWGMSDRPYSGLLVDEVASAGLMISLIATDDTHYYNGDQCRGFIAADEETVRSLGIAETIRRGAFYASTGPEIHLEKISENKVRLTCSPAVKVAFLSNTVWSEGRMIRGENITSAEYTIKPNDTFLRAEVTDSEGRVGYSNIIRCK